MNSDNRVRGTGFSAVVALAALAMGVSTIGCAHVKVVDATTLRDGGRFAHGVHFGRPHPYLVVTMEPPPKESKEGDKGKPSGDGEPVYKIQVVYLSEGDYVADVKPGWGTASGSIKLDSSGSLIEYGSVSDSKIPETITAFSGLITAAAGAHMMMNPDGRGSMPLQPGLYRAVFDSQRRITGFSRVNLTLTESAMGQPAMHDQSPPLESH